MNRRCRLVACLFLSGITSQAQTDPDQVPVTFSKDIAHIIYQNCVVCHRKGGIGPFALDNFKAVQKRARQIAEVTESHYMPPWKPDRGYGPPLQGQRRLSEEQIQAINHWADQGAPAGDLTKAPPHPQFLNNWKLGEPDLIIELPEAYSLTPEGLDVYRNFVIPLPIKEPIYVRAFELLPETQLAIHHALLMLDPTDRSSLQDAAEAGPGYDGMGIGSSVPPSGHIVGWTPGQVPYQAYPGTAWAIEPGTDMVLQLHMLPSGKTEKINPKIGLYLSKEPPNKPSFVFQMRSYDLNIPAGESDYLVEQSLQVTAPIRVVSVYPHAHYVGKDLQLFAVLPDGAKQWLLRISDWDFNWQGDYRYVEPVQLPAGSVIHMSYHFDNSEANPRNPNSPPKEIIGGWRSVDEMAEAMIQVMPVDPADLPKLQSAQKKYDFQLAGGEARFYYFSAIYLEQQNEFTRAMASYQNALKLDPSFASAYFRLGALVEREGDLNQAEALYQEALAYQPDLISARLAVAKLMMQRNQIRQAGFILEEVYAESPDHLLACLYLTHYYLARNQIDKALETFKAGESVFSDSAQFQLEYGQAFIGVDRNAALARLKRASETIPEHPGQGALQPLKMIQSEAFYQMALLQEEDGNHTEADRALDECLAHNADHLDALLKSADLALKNGNTKKAFARIQTLVDRPMEKTFSYQDILANLSLPEGASILANAYKSLGKTQSATDSLAYAITMLSKRGESAQGESLRKQLEGFGAPNIKP